MTSLLEKARELGQAIKESAEFQELKRTTDNLQQNPEAVEMIRHMQEIRDQIDFVRASGLEPSREQIDRFNDLSEKVRNNLLVISFMKAQENFGKFMERVNNAISQGIEGAD
ncbi:MAG: YlbF family regulator [Dethiobacteria bacterium]|jgi:cell fate (sporulation/competence/biofilm development) regulator YlbF (YheA/YmcA/DUF963 family)|nr:YlbF family regulator [Bacillota bacterium]HOP69581.1 YlbF family regulator [Bacillota bacterium]HPT34510.1 YlbF family regulator [Bacillota bacterium]HQD06347.1 YlbF family regulator [Bacillota bacterium]